MQVPTVIIITGRNAPTVTSQSPSVKVIRQDGTFQPPKGR